MHNFTEPAQNEEIKINNTRKHKKLRRRKIMLKLEIINKVTHWLLHEDNKICYIQYYITVTGSYRLNAQY